MGIIKDYIRKQKQTPLNDEMNIIVDITRPKLYENLSTNSVNTSKYTKLSFFPMNFFYQFSKIANVYFLILTIL